MLPYSEAVGYKYKGEGYMVGALPRMNLNKEMLHKSTRKDASKFLGRFPSKNIFDNNLAQAIEILHCVDHSIELLESNTFKEEKSDPIKIKEGMGGAFGGSERHAVLHAFNRQDWKDKRRQYNSPDTAEPDMHGEERCPDR